MKFSRLSEYTAELYGAVRGSYNAYFGSLELEAPAGTPEVFVIGGGPGIPGDRRKALSEHRRGGFPSGGASAAQVL